MKVRPQLWRGAADRNPSGLGSDEAAAERKAEAYSMYVEALSEARTKYQPKTEGLHTDIE